MALIDVEQVPNTNPISRKRLLEGRLTVLLIESDKAVIAQNISDAQREEWVAYHAELNNLSITLDNLDTILFPNKPT